MLILKNKLTGFYYIGPNGEAYCYGSAAEVPKEIRAIPEVEAEYLESSGVTRFTTGLYNCGIRTLQAGTKALPLHGDSVNFVRPMETERLLAKFLLQKQMGDYEALFGQEAYFLIKFLPNGFLSPLNTNWQTAESTEPNYVPLAFVSYHLANSFLQDHGFTDRRILSYRMPDPCVLVGNHCQILLEREKNHG